MPVIPVRAGRINSRTVAHTNQAIKVIPY
jgi:hypothetical protein